MNVRFRQTARRLQASLTETHRQGAKVRSEHIASLGSVPLTLSVQDRIAFWTKLHQRLSALSNRVAGARVGAILAAIHARIPIVTQDEVQALRRAEARKDVDQWERIAALGTSLAADQKGLKQTIEAAIARFEQTAADSAACAEEAKQRLARIEAGDAVPVPVPTPMTRADFLKAVGMTEAGAMHSERLARVGEVLGDEVLPVIAKEGIKARERAEQKAVRTLHDALFERVPK